MYKCDNYVLFLQSGHGKEGVTVLIVQSSQWGKGGRETTGTEN